MIFNSAKLKGKITEVFGTQDKFGEAMGWSAAKTSTRLADISKWRLTEIRKAVEVLEIPPADLSLYFFSVSV